MTKFYVQKKDVFDISKVTVVGSPTISEYGVASNLSQAGYFTAPFIDFKNKAFSFKARVKFTDFTGVRNVIFGQQGKDNILPSLCLQGNKLRVYGPTDGTKYDSWSVDTFTPQINTWYDVELIMDLSNFIVKINGDEVAKKASSGITYDIGTNVVCLGTTLTIATWKLNGSIDLSQFSITVDGKEVFTPTKPTYLLERRKPKVWNKGQFTIVGNPSISESGIASGFSSANYLQTPATIDFANTNSWSLETSFITPNSFTAINSIYSGNISYNGIRFTINATGQLGVALSSVTTGYDIGAITGLQLTPNTKYWSRVKFTGSKYILEYSTDGKKYIETGTSIVSSTKIMSSVGKIGVNNNNNTPFLGSIDLKQFKIYTDNNLIFDGGAETYVYDPSKFTVVGSPTITEYGVASGFSENNRLEIKNVGDLLKVSNNWAIELPIITGSGFYTPRQEILGGNIDSSPYALILRTWTNTRKISVNINGVSNTDRFTFYSVNDFQDNTKYLLKIVCKNNKVKLYVDGVLDSERDITENVNFNSIIRLATSQNTSNYFQGSIDLSQFSITVDGKEVFTGAKEKFYAMRGGK